MWKASTLRVAIHLSSFLRYVADINVARHVDVDGVSGVSLYATEGSIYGQTVIKARMLVRRIEGAVQCAYDDGSALHLAAQTIGASEAVESATAEVLAALATALRADIAHTQYTMEALLDVGLDQAKVAESEYADFDKWWGARGDAGAGVDAAGDTEMASRSPSGRPLASVAASR